MAKKKIIRDNDSGSDSGSDSSSDSGRGSSSESDHRINKDQRINKAKNTRTIQDLIRKFVKKPNKDVVSKPKSESSSSSSPSPCKHHHRHKKHGNKKKVEETEEEEEEYEDEGEDEEEDEDEDEDEGEKEKKRKHINIIFTINNERDEYDDDEDDDYEEEDEDDSQEDEDTENEDEEVSSDEDDEDDEDEDEHENDSNEDENSDKKSECKNETLVLLRELLAKSPNDKSIKKCIAQYEADLAKQQKKLEKKTKKQKEKNTRIFRKMLIDKNANNDFAFYNKLDIDKQKTIIKELREINKIIRVVKPRRMSLLESTIPVKYKAIAINKINSMRSMRSDSEEYYKLKTWMDGFMKIPFSEFKELPINIHDGIDRCHEFMENAQKTLDEAVYGLNDAKMQIMQMLGQFLTNPKAIGTAIAIHGPPGTGKTSLVKEGISKILNRPFAFIALGGATDSAFLEGHGYTYIGSMWGKIVQILIDSKCMNPIIYFDELDKISDTPKGDEIAGILTHLTDTTQNSQFHDKYFTDIDFDLSKCLFIFSYNDESKINPILKDRMYRIKTKGYSGKERASIANHYLMPKIREQVKFVDGDILISDDVLNYINETHCHKEDGVRNMKRCLEVIHTKLNLYRLMKPGSNIFEKDMSLKVEFPVKVTKDMVDKLIKKDSDGLETWRALYL